MKRIFHHNAIIRLFSTYLVVLLLLMATCLTGFGRALDIVETNTLQENSSLLKQGSRDMDYFLQNLYTCGMKLVSSKNLKQLGACTDTDSLDYYYQVKKELSDFAEALKYMDSEIYLESFIYVNGVDRILFQSGAYTESVFESYLKKWGISAEEWASLCNSSAVAPYFYVTSGGEWFYLFPCFTGIQKKEQLATVFFHINSSFLVNKWQFLQNYNTYSLFILQEKDTLLSLDNMAVSSRLEGLTPPVSPGNHALRVENYLILQQESSFMNGTYLLILPENEALSQIRRLKLFLFFPLGLALVAGIGFAVYCAVKNGKPINNIAKTIGTMQKDTSDTYNTDLSYLDTTIEQIIEEQKTDKGALQQSFFHNLLKADFVSRTELEYMAKRADIPLVGKEYFAAAVRLFPQIDTDHIDGQTVEEARALQLLLNQYLQAHYFKSLWFYKRNTLVVQYIIEADSPDMEKLTRAIRETLNWLKDLYHVDSYWGISTACRDLMHFWRNGEEAYTALQYAGQYEPILIYSEIKDKDSSFYLPYSMEEHLAQGLRSGDFEQVGQAVDMLREENIQRRKLDRKQFLKLSRRISDILAAQCSNLDETEEYLIRLNSYLIENNRNDEAYFSELKEICYRICGIAAGQKSLKRNNKIKAIQQYMEENFSNTAMGLSMVSEAFGLSEGYLSALFKEEMGVNFGDYLEDIRLKEACRLLKDGVLVAEIAERTGYNSVQSFRRAFKRSLGISPSEYRAE